MAPLILLALLALPFVEIAVFIRVGAIIGIGATIALTLVGSCAGAVVIRLAGLAMLGRARAAIAQNEPPVDDLLDGLCILFAGVLLLVPGFVTDALGLLLLAPWVRRRVRRRIWGMFEATERRVHGTVIEAEYTIIENEGREEPKSETRRLDKSQRP